MAQKSCLPWVLLHNTVPHSRNSGSCMGTCLLCHPCKRCGIHSFLPLARSVGSTKTEVLVASSLERCQTGVGDTWLIQDLWNPSSGKCLHVHLTIPWSLFPFFQQQIAFKNLVQRNQQNEQQNQGPPALNSTIQLPFLIVNTSKRTIIDCSISSDK